MSVTGDSIQILLKRRRIMRWLAVGIAALLIASSVLDHTHVFGYSGNPQARFDRQRAIVTRVIEGDTFVVRLAGESEEIPVHLLGVDSPRLPGDYWADRTQKYSEARALNRTVTLRLDSIGWRNDRGEVLAYLYLTDADNLNLDLIHDGQAYADRRTAHSLHSPFELAENEARTKKRGLWREVTKEQMPAWRRQWLASRGF